MPSVPAGVGFGINAVGQEKANQKNKAFADSILSSDEKALDWVVENRTLEPDKAAAVMGKTGLSNDDINAWAYSRQNPDDPASVKARNRIFGKLAESRKPLDETKGFPAVNRVVINMLAEDDENGLVEKYMQDRGYMTRLKDGKVQIKKPDEAAYYGMEPTQIDRWDFTGWIKEKALDAAELSRPLVEMGVVTAATGAKAISSLAGPVGFAGSALASGAAMGSLEAGRQGLAKAVGLRDEFDTNKIRTKAEQGFVFGAAAPAFGKMLEKAGDVVGEGVARFTRWAKKPAADKIEQAAKALGAKATPAQLFDDPAIQKAEESIVKGGDYKLGAVITKLPQQVEANKRAVQSAADDIVKDRSFKDTVQEAISVGKSLQETTAAKTAPAEAIYDKYEAMFKDFKGLYPDTAKIKNTLDELKSTFKFNDDAMAVINTQKKKLGQIKTLDDLKNFRTSTGELLRKQNDPRGTWAAQKIYQASTEVRADTLLKGARIRGMGNAKEEIEAADKLYRAVNEEVSAAILNRGDVMVGGPKAAVAKVIKNTKEINLIKKVLDTNDPKRIEAVKKAYPTEFESMRRQVIENIAGRAQKDGEVNPQKLANIIDKLPADSKRLIFGDNALKKAEDLKVYLDSIPRPFNASNTANQIEFNKAFYNVPAQINNAVKGVFLEVMANTQLGRSALQRSGKALQTPTAKGIAAGLPSFFDGNEPKKEQPKGLAVPSR